jgi:hypothetical protein
MGVLTAKLINALNKKVDADRGLRFQLSPDHVYIIPTDDPLDARC